MEEIYMDLDEYLITNSENLNMSTIVQECNVSIPTVYRHLRQKGLKLKKVDCRVEEMKKLRKEGKTYQEIGNIFGLSRQRIEQIINVSTDE